MARAEQEGLRVQRAQVEAAFDRWVTLLRDRGADTLGLTLVGELGGWLVCRTERPSGARSCQEFGLRSRTTREMYEALTFAADTLVMAVPPRPVGPQA